MDSRERILNAAVELLTEEGLPGLSMREVARRSGVSHQAPYHHFKNREAILAAIAEDGFKKFNAVLEAASGNNAASRLIAAGRAYIGFAQSNPAHFQLMFRPEFIDLTKYPSAVAESDRGLAILQSLVDGLVKEKFLPPSRTHGMVILSWAVVRGLSGLLLEGSLTKKALKDRKTTDQMELALHTLEFLISRHGKK